MKKLQKLFLYIIFVKKLLNKNSNTMKKLLKIKLFTLILALLFTTKFANAQTDMVQFLAAGTADANKLINGYASPLLETIGNNLNNGWYNTADPLKLGRFAITIGATASFVPTDKQSFEINPSDGYSTITTADGLAKTSPTVFGDKTTSANLNIVLKNGTFTATAPFEAPKGTGVSISPLPIAQLSVGLIKGTEVMVRWLPSIDMDGVKTNYFGFGVKHNIKQWIPVIKSLPFDLSFIGAFTSAEVKYFGEQFLKADNTINNPSPNTDYTNQGVNFSSSAWNVNLIISKKLPIISFFGGFRLSHYSSNLDLVGNYPVTILNNSGVKEVATLTDPINVEGSGTSFGFNGGLRIKLGFFALFTEGTWVPGGYSSASGGIALGFFN